MRSLPQIIQYCLLLSVLTVPNTWSQTNRAYASLLPQVTARQIGYGIRRWMLEDGLPLDRVWSLAQTKDGYLWIGADSGKLCRFDGTRFTLIETDGEPLGYLQSYTHLLADSRGGLWIRGNELALGRYFEGEFQEVHGMDRMSEKDRGPMVEGMDGSLWIAGRNPARFYHWTENHTKVIEVDVRTPSQYAIQLRASDRGEIWGLWNDHRLFQLTDEGPKDYAWDEDDEVLAQRIGGLTKLISGELAVCSSTGIYQLKGDRWVKTREWSAPIESVAHMEEDASGSLWMATEKSGELLCAQDDRIVRVAMPDAKLPMRFFALLRDSFENIWIATHQGLFQVRTTMFRTWSTEEGLQGHRILSISTGIGSQLWFKPQADGVYGRVSRHPQYDIVENVPVESTARFVLPIDGDSRWLVSERGGIWLWQDRPMAEVKEIIPEKSGSHVQDVLHSKKGDLWVATRGALYRFDGENIAPMTFSDGTLLVDFNALAQDSLGRIYANSFLKGVYVFENDSVRLLQNGHEPVNEIDVIDATPEGTLWAIRANRQLACWRDGQWHLLDLNLTRNLARIISLGVDHDNGLWLGTESQGVVWMNRRQLEEYAEGTRADVDSTSYGRYEGLGSLACDGFASGIVNDPAGRLWIATADGISMVNPKELARQKKDSSLPTVSIEEVLVDDAPLALGAESISPPSLRVSRPSANVPPGRNRIEVKFSAIDLASVEHVRFQYRLKNYSDAWEDAGAGRSAVYHRIPPGKYSFEVRAANAHGVWNPKQASLRMEFAPRWWQRSEVQLAFGLALFLGVWWIYQTRVRAMKRRHALQESFSRELINSQERERARISGELHDGLGQNLLVIKSGTSMALRHMDKPEKLRVKLTELAQISDEAVKEVRQISHALRPMHLDQLGLTKAIAAMVRKVGESAVFDIESHLEPIDGLLPPEFEINLYRVIQESLNNIQKHARASIVNLSIQASSAGEILFVISDDGCGFDTRASRDGEIVGGMGLQAMRERVYCMNGSIEIKSRLGGGTRIQMIIPVPSEGRI